MTEIAIGVALLAIVVGAVYLLGKNKQKTKQATKTATISRNQAKVATKKRKRTAKGVAEDIKKGGL